LDSIQPNQAVIRFTSIFKNGLLLISAVVFVLSLSFRSSLAFGNPPQNTEQHAVLQDRTVAFVTAAAQGNLGEIERMLAQGIDANSIQTDRRMSALHGAAANGHTQVVARLLAAGADPWAVDFLGATPLVNAAYAGHLPVINLFLERITAEKKDVKQRLAVADVSPLYAAVLGGHRAAVERFLVAGFPSTAKERSGDDPINAARRAKRPDLLELLERAR
jgi:uncharacterized protein